MQKPINFKDITIGAIPTSYLNSLTYEEQILTLLKAMNDVINNENELTEEFKILKVKIEEIETKVVNFEKYTDEEIIKLRNELIILINNSYIRSKNYIDYNISILNEKINNITLDNLDIRNPVNGLLENIEKVVNDIFYFGTNGITASNFDNLELTASEFDSKDITALEFDIDSNNL